MSDRDHNDPLFEPTSAAEAAERAEAGRDPEPSIAGPYLDPADSMPAVGIVEDAALGRIAGGGLPAGAASASMTAETVLTHQRALEEQEAGAATGPRGPEGPEGSEPLAPAESPETAVTNKTMLILRRVLRNKGALVGLVMLLVAVAFVMFGQVGNPYTYDDQDLLNLGSPPGMDGHRLGTNAGGLDLWAMLVRGTGKSLLIAVVVGVGTPLIAAVYGTAIAFWGGTRERAGMWFVDMMILMPYFLIVAVLMGSTGGGAMSLALILLIFGWPGMARVVRATTQSLREREFVHAARYMGVSDWNIIRRHIIPNLGSYLIINIVLGTFGAIIAETALSFLGVGVRPPDVSLGQLIGDSSSQLAAYPWLFWGPTVCLQWLTVSLALIGDGVRDALDPNSASGGRA